MHQRTSDQRSQVHKVEENENLKMDLGEEGRKWTYSNGDSDQVDLLYFSSWVQHWAPLEKLMRYGNKDLEKSQRVKGFREMMARVEIKLHYLLFLTFSINTRFQSNNIIINCSFLFYHFYSDNRFSKLLWLF